MPATTFSGSDGSCAAALPGVGICHPPGGGMQEFDGPSLLLVRQEFYDFQY